MMSFAMIMTCKVLLICLSAPLVSGMIRKMKNIVRMRKGPGILQPYCDLMKLFSKEEVVSKNVSWIFYASPAIVFSSGISALLLILIASPGYQDAGSFAFLIAAFFVLGLGRFFQALAGIDAGSSFGGMGSSREMFISSFAEPAAFISIFVLCVSGPGTPVFSFFLAAAALFMVILAETSRIPVDNRETHLELTMVHEAMLLEYSGPSLGLIELTGHIRQMIFFTMLSWYLFPVARAGSLGWILFGLRIMAIILAVALVEVSVAKMRLFRVVDFLSFAFFIALVASIAAGLGV